VGFVAVVPSGSVGFPERVGFVVAADAGRRVDLNFPVLNVAPQLGFLVEAVADRFHHGVLRAADPGFLLSAPGEVGV